MMPVPNPAIYPHLPMLFGLPLGTVVTLGVIVALPVAAYGLYRIDNARADGHVTVLGYRAYSSETE